MVPHPFFLIKVLPKKQGHALWK
jgi:hypothetical protein